MKSHVASLLILVLLVGIVAPLRAQTSAPLRRPSKEHFRLLQQRARPDSMWKRDSLMRDTTRRDSMWRDSLRIGRRDSTFRDSTWRDSTRNDPTLKRKPKPSPKPKRDSMRISSLKQTLLG